MPRAPSTTGSRSKIVHNDRPIIYLYNQLTIAGYSTSITGLQLSGGGMLIPDYAEYK